MIKTVSFNDISQLQIIDSNISYSIETKCQDGLCNNKLYFIQLLYIYFNYEKDIFEQFIDINLIQENKSLYLDYFQEIINHLKHNRSYSLYKYSFKIRKKTDHLNKLKELYNYCVDL